MASVDVPEDVKSQSSGPQPTDRAKPQMTIK